MCHVRQSPDRLRPVLKSSVAYSQVNPTQGSASSPTGTPCGCMAGSIEAGKASQQRWHLSWVLKDGEEFVESLIFDQVIKISKDRQMRD